MPTKLTFLCISSYHKGEDFLKSCKQEGNKVFLLTAKCLDDKWKREFIDDVFFVEEKQRGIWDMEDVKNGLAHFMKSTKIDRIVALDDFDVEKASFLREHFRFPGMGQTTSRYFRDKLAMRMKAQESGIDVPAFTSIFNDEEVNNYVAKTKAPWVLKPRFEASATGIKKVNSKDELWAAIHQTGDERHNCLVEQFRPGDVYHVDTITVDGKVIFCQVSQYLNPPFDVAHGGGIFQSHTVEYDSDDDKALRKLNEEVLKSFGMQFSASHTEFIKCKDDCRFYFLETSSRVGGAHLAEMVEVASDINLWAEWARVETAKASGKKYKAPKSRKGYAGIIVSLSRFQHPDDSTFDDKEIVWRLKKDHHIGLIIKAKSRKRILELLDKYAVKIRDEFHASAPAPAKSTD
ncbi:MAG: ATPase [Cyclobacteriaceae bacterium]